MEYSGTQTDALRAIALSRSFTIERFPEQITTASTGKIFSITQRPLVAITDAETRTRVQWHSFTTPHYAISFDRICYHEREAISVAEQLEEAYASIVSATQEGFHERIPVYLCDLRSPSLLGRKTSTHFNVGERAIYLVRSAQLPADAELLHMVVHSTRFERYLKHYGITPGWAMLEDAYATFVATRLSAGHTSYPFFGFEPDVIAHYLIGQSFLPDLAYAWHGINFASDLERSVLAGAFLLFLGDMTNDEAVIALSKTDDDVTSDTFGMIFGRSLEELEHAWKSHLPKTLTTITDAERQEMISAWLTVMSKRNR